MEKSIRRYKNITHKIRSRKLRSLWLVLFSSVDILFVAITKMLLLFILFYKIYIDIFIITNKYLLVRNEKNKPIKHTKMTLLLNAFLYN